MKIFKKRENTIIQPEFLMEVFCFALINNQVMYLLFPL